MVYWGRTLPRAGLIRASRPLETTRLMSDANAHDQQEPATTAAAAARSGGGNVVAPLLLILASLGAAGLLVWGALRFARDGSVELLAAGWLALVTVLAAAAVAVAVGRAARLDRRLTTLADAVGHLRGDLGAVSGSLRKIDEHTLISERAKRVAYRDRDRDAVRQAIHEDLLAGDFASARLLADEFERAFGYAQEAERFREEIRRHVDQTRSRELDDAAVKLDRLCDQERWAEANAEADKLISKFGGDMRVRLLRTRIEEKRQQRKVSLVQKFHDARGRQDADAAADLLKQLDTYLTPDEGQQLEKDAREVFRVRLLQLKDRFTEAMHGHDYAEALRVGSIIRSDFPNSQMAKEVALHEKRLRDAAGLAPEEEPPA